MPSFSRHVTSDNTTDDDRAYPITYRYITRLRLVSNDDVLNLVTEDDTLLCIEEGMETEQDFRSTKSSEKNQLRGKFEYKMVKNILFYICIVQ